MTVLRPSLLRSTGGMALSEPLKNMFSRSVCTISSAWCPSAILLHCSRTAVLYRMPRRSLEQRAHVVSPSGHFRLHDGVRVLLDNPERHPDFGQVTGQNLRREAGLLLIQIDGEKIKPHRSPGLQVAAGDPEECGCPCRRSGTPSPCRRPGSSRNQRSPDRLPRSSFLLTFWSHVHRGTGDSTTSARYRTRPSLATARTGDILRPWPTCRCQVPRFRRCVLHVRAATRRATSSRRRRPSFLMDCGATALASLKRVGVPHRFHRRRSGQPHARRPLRRHAVSAARIRLSSNPARALSP